jgi:hypothetical protein
LDGRSPLRGPWLPIDRVGVGNSQRVISVWLMPRDRSPLHRLGVCDNPDTVSPVRRAGVPSTHHERPRGVVCRFQVIEYPVSSESSETRNILSDDPIWSEFSNEPSEFVPETTSFAVETGAAARLRNVLAGEAAGDEIDGNSIGSKALRGERSDVIEDRNLGPVMGKDAPAEIVGLAERDGSHSGSFEPEAEAANSAEEVEDIHLFFQCINGVVAGPSGPKSQRIPDPDDDIDQDEANRDSNHDQDPPCEYVRSSHHPAHGQILLMSRSTKQRIAFNAVTMPSEKMNTTSQNIVWLMTGWLIIAAPQARRR